MTLDAAQVRVAVTGQVLRGPLGTTAPTGTTGPVPTGMNDLGFIDDKGITEDPNKSTKVVKAWQNGATVRVIVTDGQLTYKFRMIQSNPDTVGTFYGTTVTSSATEGSFAINPIKTGGRQCFLFEILDGAEHRRIWVPQGEVTDTTAITYANSDEEGYEVTVSAYYDDTIGGNAMVWDTALKTAA